jgi:hypothetical protein
MHNFLGIQEKADNFRKGFFIDPYDEPTFLTFSIDFNFEGLVLNLREQDLWGSPLFSEEDDDSAISFLKRRDYLDKAHSLKVFKETFKYLTYNAPWYFQSVSGITNLWKGAINIEGGVKGKDANLTIETLEAVDLRITKLADIYRNVIYDKQYMRERVPDNLRWFSADLYIAEARNLRVNFPGISQPILDTLGINTGRLTSAAGSILGATQGISGLKLESQSLSNLLQQYGYVKFKLRQCEFDFSETIPSTKYEVETPRTPSTNKFMIKVGYFEEENRYADGTRLYDDLGKSNRSNPFSGLRNIGAQTQATASFLSGLPLIGDPIQNAGETLQNSLAKIGGLINPSLESATNFLYPPVENLGNIYN